MFKFGKKWQIALQTLPLVLGLVLIKFLVAYFELELISVHPLYTSVVAGGIFLFSLILAGTLSDYKESERFPAEIASSCESIYQEGLYCLETRPGFNMDLLRSTLCNVLTGIRRDIENTGLRTAEEALIGLSASFTEMERLGLSVSYITRMKTEQAVIRRSLMRFYYIQRINFLPSAYILVQSIVVLIIALLILSKITPLSDSLVIVFFLTYLFIYILKLLKVLERPFQKEGKTMDDVSLFLLEECEKRIRSEK